MVAQKELIKQALEGIVLKELKNLNKEEKNWKQWLKKSHEERRTKTNKLTKLEQIKFRGWIVGIALGLKKEIFTIQQMREMKKIIIEEIALLESTKRILIQKMQKNEVVAGAASVTGRRDGERHREDLTRGALPLALEGVNER